MIEGTFVVIEGIDGAGTTTQTRRLVRALTESGLPVVETREPTAGPVGSILRLALQNRLVVPGAHGPRPPSWKTMALLFAADRVDHLETEIIPNLMDGVTVVSDRYDLSSLAYQSVTSNDEGASTAWIRTLNTHARRPDLTVVLDVTPRIAESRRRGRSAAIELYDHTEIQAELAVAYRQAEALVPGDHLVHVDGDRDEDAVFADVIAAVRAVRNERPKA